jgi:hypothetical protein
MLIKPHATLDLRAHCLLGVARELGEAGDCDFIQHGLRSNSRLSRLLGDSLQLYQDAVVTVAVSLGVVAIAAVVDACEARPLARSEHFDVQRVVSLQKQIVHFSCGHSCITFVSSL